MVDGHRAELVALEEFAVLAHTVLDEERWAAGHLDFDQDRHDRVEPAEAD